MIVQIAQMAVTRRVMASVRETRIDGGGGGEEGGSGTVSELICKFFEVWEGF